jgi:hypothetical protein
MAAALVFSFSLPSCTRPDDVTAPCAFVSSSLQSPDGELRDDVEWKVTFSRDDPAEGRSADLLPGDDSPRSGDGVAWWAAAPARSAESGAFFGENVRKTRLKLCLHACAKR